MSNTLTGLIPIFYKGMDMVRREIVGMIPAVDTDASAAAAAVGQIINTPVIPDASGGDIVPGQLPPDDGDQVIGMLPMSIQKSRYSPIRWNGEEVLGYASNGTFEDTLAKQFAQSLRWLTNQVETDLCVTARLAASRAYGTAGTAPFGIAGDLSDIAQVNKMLTDNGCPMTPGDLNLIMNTTSGANMRGKQSTLFKVNESGDGGAMLRNGSLGRLSKFDIGESAQISNVTKGTGNAYTTTTAGFAIGTLVIPLITGTGTVLAGDVVTFAGDTNKYVVAAGVAAPGSITLAKPGLMQAIPAAATALTIGNNFGANLAFHRNAMKLLCRTPAMPPGGDVADDVYDLTDPVSGIVYQVAVYRLYRRVKYEVGLAWGTAAIKSEFIQLLLS